MDKSEGVYSGRQDREGKPGKDFPARDNLLVAMHRGGYIEAVFQRRTRPYKSGYTLFAAGDYMTIFNTAKDKIEELLFRAVCWIILLF